LTSWASRRSAELPLEYLRELGVVSAPLEAVAEGPLEQVLAEYRRYLLIERRLSEHTVGCYVPVARLFLAGEQGPDGLALERLSAADVSGFLASECPKRSVSGARDLGERGAVAVALPARDRVDRAAAGVGGSVGRQLARSLATPWS
jgi:Phage integrase, N-terminal SAM-like domain